MQRAFTTSLRAVARTARTRAGCSCGAGPSLARRAALAPLTRTFAWSALARNDAVRAAPPHLPADPDTDTPALAAPTGDSPSPGVIKTDPRKAISFNCGVENCGVRQTHEFAKKSYEKGIVIVQCPGCKSRHLIADHLGWFKEITAEGAQRTIEDFAKAQGVAIKRGHIDPDGAVTEYAPE